MTYYKSQEEVAEEIDNKTLKKSPKNIPLLVEKVLENIKGFLIITNVTPTRKKRFYSLKLDHSQIHLVEKNSQNIKSFCYKIKNNKLLINDIDVVLSKENPAIYTDFCIKIYKIIEDLKNHKAFALEKK